MGKELIHCSRTEMTLLIWKLPFKHPDSCFYNGDFEHGQHWFYFPTFPRDLLEVGVNSHRQGLQVDVSSSPSVNVWVYQVWPSVHLPCHLIQTCLCITLWSNKVFVMVRTVQIFQFGQSGVLCGLWHQIVGGLSNFSTCPLTLGWWPRTISCLVLVCCSQTAGVVCFTCSFRFFSHVLLHDRGLEIKTAELWVKYGWGEVNEWCSLNKRWSRSKNVRNRFQCYR